MKPIHVFALTFGGCALVVLVMILWSAMGSLVTAKNDMAVLAGLVIAALLVSALVAVLYAVGKKGAKVAQKYTDNRKRGGGTALVMLLGLVASAELSGGCTKVEPGYAGIKVNSYGSQRGVDDFPISTGRVWYNPFTEDVHKFPTFMQNAIWTKSKTEGSPGDDSISFNSVEGVVINADVAVAYQFVYEQVPAVFVEFKQDADVITHGYLRNHVRDAFSRAASTMKVMEILGPGKSKLEAEALRDLNEKLQPKFKLEMVSLINELRVDDRVHNSINAVIEATQKALEAQNKVVQAEAEANQKKKTADGEAYVITTVARAQAEANIEVAKSLTPELVQWKMLERWNGTAPLVIGGNGVSMLMPLPTKASESPEKR